MNYLILHIRQGLHLVCRPIQLVFSEIQLDLTFEVAVVCTDPSSIISFGGK